MDADWIIAAFIIIDTMLERLEYRRYVLPRVPDAEIMTVAIVANRLIRTRRYHSRVRAEVTNAPAPSR